jgi:hypothetical protein
MEKFHARENLTNDGHSLAGPVSITLHNDLLSPLLAGLLFPDFIQRFIIQRFIPGPIYGVTSRANVLNAW